MTQRTLGEIQAIIGKDTHTTKGDAKSIGQLKGYWQKRQSNAIKRAIHQAKIGIYAEMEKTGFTDAQIQQILEVEL